MLPRNWVVRILIISIAPKILRDTIEQDLPQLITPLEEILNSN